MYSNSIKYDSKYHSDQTLLWDNPEAVSKTFLSFVVGRSTVENEKKNEYKKNVSERLKYLSENLDDDQDEDIFKKSKKIVDKFIGCVKTTDVPLISVDDTGYIVLEWRDYNHYDVVAILFKTTENISYVAVKQKKIVLKGSGLVSEVANLIQKSKDD